MDETLAAPDDEVVEGDIETEDDAVPIVSFEVTSFGSDPEVESLVARIRRGDIVIPPFQRDYVWRQPEASKFVESLLLGLPVPGIFLATDPNTNKQVVIDGQQRLKTLRFFYDGFFNPKEGDKTQRVFSLIKVQPQFDGKTYKTLEEHDRIRLDTSVIHATTVRQTSPTEDNTSLYHIFERLNSGGRRLTDQEMRTALYHGNLIEYIKTLNKDERWRSVFGKVHSRLKDQELILRFFALFDRHSKYQRPLAEFLTKYANKNRNPSAEKLTHLGTLFVQSLHYFSQALPERPFRPTKTFNVAVYDSCMVGIATRIEQQKQQPLNLECVLQGYRDLLTDKEYVEAISRSTADDAFVKRRISKAIAAFSNC